METRWNTKEGFDMFETDYFKNVKRRLSIPGVKKIIEFIEKYLGRYGNPIQHIDKGIENFIKQALILLIGQMNCNPDGTISGISGGLSGLSGFTWANNQLDLLSKQISKKPVTTIKNNVNYAGEIIQSSFVEGLSMNDTPTLITTIQSFMTTHPKIKNMTALTNLYISELNKYEKSIGANLTTEQLFEFNNQFANELDNEIILKKLQEIEIALPPPSYPNTEAGYKNFMKKTARFRFEVTNTTEIVYYPLNEQYFPYPINMSDFQNLLSNTSDPNFISSLNSFLQSVNTPALPPNPPSQSLPIDPNYAFSVDLTATQTASMLSYIDYIVQYFSFVVYHIQGNGGTMSFPAILANVCVTYINYINAVEFQKYRVYGTFLTHHEVALFNHLFFICLHQDYSTLNIYNIAVSSINPASLLEMASPYINLVPQNIYGLVSMFVTQINLRVPNLITNQLQPLPIDGVLSYPPRRENDFEGPLLTDYILGYSDDVYVPDIVLDDFINEYYIPPGLEACEKANQVVQKECEQYAKVIKNEIYRLFTIPIFVYIIYNAYYLFFFKDCYGQSKTVDEEGNISYVHSCEAGYFTPIFPDWETSFHNVAGNKLDYLFEFIFKPVKILYTLLNSFKTIFRKPILGIVIKDKYPYLFFGITAICMFMFLQSYGAEIIKMIYGLFSFNTPKTMYRISQAIITIFFILTFFKDVFDMKFDMGDGDEDSNKGSFSSMGKDIYKNAKNNLDRGTDFLKKSVSGAFTSIKPPKSAKEAWGSWIMTPGSGAFMMILKMIYFILFWMFKYIISIGLTGASVMISIIYFCYTLIFGINNYSTPVENYNSKVELMFRIMYTKLCDNKKDGIFMYSLKSVFFFGIYFLTECIIIYKLLKGMNEFRKMPTPPPPFDPHFSSKNTSKLTDNNLAVKSSMIIMYFIMLALVGLWCVYKFKFKMFNEIIGYKEDTTDDAFDKKYDYKPGEPTIIEKESGNGVIKTMFWSDSINKKFIDEFNKELKKYDNRPSMFENVINKAVEYKDKIKDGLNSVASSVENTMTSSTGSSTGSSTESSTGSSTESSTGSSTEPIEPAKPFSRYTNTDVLENTTKGNANDVSKMITNNPIANSLGNTFSGLKNMLSKKTESS